MDRKLKIVYYHGYNSYLPQQRRNILEQYGSLKAPAIDYLKFPSIDLFLKEHAEPASGDTDIFVGSSMGGLTAYHAALRYDIACLLFNPAFYFNNFPIVPLPEYKGSKFTRTTMTYIVLGEKDTVVDCDQNLKFIQDYVIEPKTVFTEPTMEHITPNEIFRKHVENFYNLITTNTQ
ncbi:MAG: YqiA/YcfP family alpha/beta fold hydrolase [Ginsengibacter sp.]